MTCIDLAARIDGAFRILREEREPLGVDGMKIAAEGAFRFREVERISTSEDGSRSACSAQGVSIARDEERETH